jgi:hypothetical protein
MINQIAHGLASAAPVSSVLLRDGAGVVGAVMIAYGAWLILPALGFIVGGCFLLAVAILTSRKDSADARAVRDDHGRMAG